MQSLTVVQIQITIIERPFTTVPSIKLYWLLVSLSILKMNLQVESSKLIPSKKALNICKTDGNYFDYHSAELNLLVISFVLVFVMKKNTVNKKANVG